MRRLALWGFGGWAVLLLSLLLSTTEAIGAARAELAPTTRKATVENSKNDFERRFNDEKTASFAAAAEAIGEAEDNDEEVPRPAINTTSSLVDRWTNTVINTDASFTFYASAILLHTAYFVQAMLGPILSLVLRVLYRLTVQPLATYVYNNAARILPSDTASSRSSRGVVRATADDSYTGRQAQSTVKTAKEDQRALKGDRRDIERLRRYGYQKYRYLSPGFLQRNGLAMPTSDEDALLAEDDDAAVVAARRGRRDR